MIHNCLSHKTRDLTSWTAAAHYRTAGTSLTCMPTQSPAPASSRQLMSFAEIKESLLKGMSEFREGEVSLVCRKNILIHSKGPGFCYFEDNRFK